MLKECFKQVNEEEFIEKMSRYRTTGIQSQYDKETQEFNHLEFRESHGQALLGYIEYNPIKKWFLNQFSIPDIQGKTTW